MKTNYPAQPVNQIEWSYLIDRVVRFRFQSWDTKTQTPIFIGRIASVTLYNDDTIEIRLHYSDMINNKIVNDSEDVILSYIVIST